MMNEPNRMYVPYVIFSKRSGVTWPTTKLLSLFEG
jgi:hypothetical protein